MPSIDKAVGVACSEYFGKTLEAWPSALTLSLGGELGDAGLKRKAHAGYSERRTRDALDALVHGGWLVVVAERAGRTTVYRAAFPAGVFEIVSGLQVVQGGLHQVHRGLQVVQDPPASGAAEVEVEVDLEEVQEGDGSHQLKITDGLWRTSVCIVCERELLCQLHGGQFWCAQHIEKASSA